MFGCYHRNKIENQMPNMTLRNITEACGGTYVGSQEHLLDVVEGVVIDSRQVKRGFLYIPIKGEKVDGHEFIPDVFEKGALSVLTEHALENPAGPYILVDSTPEAMKAIAAFYRAHLPIKVVGITGSVGKTSTKEMVSSVLSQKYSVLKTAGNYNNEIGLPLTIFQIHSCHQVAVLEMGISDFGEMHRLAAMANPDICVITNIGLCHLENLHTRDGILQAKTESFEHLTPEGIAILNGDDDKLCTQTEVNGRPAIFYGLGAEAKTAKTENAEAKTAEMMNEEAKTAESGTRMAVKSIYATDVENLGFEGIKANIHTPQGTFEAHIPIAGEHNVYNALAATAVGLQLELTLEEIAAGIAAVQTISGRTNFLDVNGMTVIDDCYNANPVSMAASLDVLSHAAGRSIAVLGDMGELGTDEKALHYQVGEVLGQKRIDTLFAAGALAKEYADAAKKANPNCEIHYFTTREDMTKELLSYVKEGDTILVKASHFMEFPKVIEELKSLAG